MKLLVVAATAAEVQPLATRLQGTVAAFSRLTAIQHPQHQIEILITGVGMVATAAWCGRTLTQRAPDLALNVGVCGSFTEAFEPGSVVHVVSDSIPELGAEDGERFLTLDELGLLGADAAFFENGRLVNPAPPKVPALDRLPAAHGITVNTVHGHEPSIARIVERCRPDVESMEGAAFVYACLTAQVPFAQIRAVSNTVERRNRAAWKLTEAVGGLSDAVAAIVTEL